MKCMFCGNSEDKVTQMVAASPNAAICDSCIFECMKLLVYGEPEPTVVDLNKETTKEDEDAQKNTGC